MNFFKFLEIILLIKNKKKLTLLQCRAESKSLSNYLVNTMCLLSNYIFKHFKCLSLIVWRNLKALILVDRVLISLTFCQLFLSSVNGAPAAQSFPVLQLVKWFSQQSIKMLTWFGTTDSPAINKIYVSKCGKKFVNNI